MNTTCLAKTKLTMDNQVKDFSNIVMILQPPRVKDRDQRCSTRCVRKWYNFGDRPPLGPYCECTKHKIIRIKNRK